MPKRGPVQYRVACKLITATPHSRVKYRQRLGISLKIDAFVQIILDERQTMCT